MEGFFMFSTLTAEHCSVQHLSGFRFNGTESRYTIFPAKVSKSLINISL